MSEVLKTEFNLKETIKNIIKPYCFRGALKGINVWFYYQPSISEVVEGDAENLNRIILRLMENAFKYAEKDYILVEVREIESCSQKTKLRFSVYYSGKCKDTDVLMSEDIEYDNKGEDASTLYFTAEFDRKLEVEAV